MNINHSPPGRILVIAPDLPYPVRAGGQMRMASFVEALSRCAQVHVACLHPDLPGETLDWCASLGVTIAAAPRQPLSGLQVWRERLVTVLTRCNLAYRPLEMPFFERERQAFQPDLVWLETPYQIRYALAWRGSLPIIANYWGTSEGAERDFRHAHGLRRVWEWLRWLSARGGEVKYAPLLAGIVTVSELDAGHFRKQGAWGRAFFLLGAKRPCRTFTKPACPRVSDSIAIPHK